MKRWNHIMMAVCMAAAASACSGDRKPGTAAKPADTPAVGTAGTAKPAADRTADRGDRDFVEKMLADGQTEIELGKMAQQKARNKQVKDFAAMIVRDHTKAAEELKTVAAHANIDTTKADNDDNKDRRDRLSTLSGMEFDREYIKAMVDDHEKAVKDAEDKAEHADNDHVKEWAAKTLPTLKKHLEQARQIDEALAKRTT